MTIYLALIDAPTDHLPFTPPPPFVLLTPRGPCARSLAMHAFRRTDADALVLIAPHVRWHLSDVERLVSSDVAIVGAIAPRPERLTSTADPSYARIAANPHEIPAPVRPELLPVSAETITPRRHPTLPLWAANILPADFLAIRREGARAIVERHSELTTRRGGETFVDVFRPETDAGGQYADEAAAFCMRWRRMGGDLWLDGRLSLSTAGPAVYVAPSFDALARGKHFLV